MFKALVVGALAALGCGGRDDATASGPIAVEEVSGPVDPVLARCAPYEAMPNAYGYCLFLNVRSIPLPEDARRLCVRAGTYAGECVRSWVSPRLSREGTASTGTLLAVCDTHADCALEVLDARAPGDLPSELDACARSAGSLGSDCAGHAAERWWLQDPTPEEIGRIAAMELPFPERIAFFVAASVVCYGKGACTGHPTFQPRCEEASATFRADRMKCPGRQRPVPPGGAAPGRKP